VVVAKDAVDPDSDGIKGQDDRCPKQPEDVDGYQDDDGCPDPDNDFDGIADGDDKCPIVKEDKDGFEDNDGCPDLDNDQDGLVDSKDKCSDVAEDGDGFEDDDGCPDPDNDKDGIADAVDKCPLQAETINGVTDGDGCADAGEPDIMVSTDRIDLLEPITFAGTTFTKKTTKVLGQIAATLQARPRIKRIRLVAHVNEHSNKAKDLELSQKRAEHVRDWLVQWGIATSRIEVRGFGSTKMLVQPLSKNAAIINDRVEFIFIEVE
jgi:large repetitive protein